MNFTFITSEPKTVELTIKGKSKFTFFKVSQTLKECRVNYSTNRYCLVLQATVYPKNVCTLNFSAHRSTTFFWGKTEPCGGLQEWRASRSWIDQWNPSKGSLERKSAPEQTLCDTYVVGLHAYYVFDLALEHCSIVFKIIYAEVKNQYRKKNRDVVLVQDRTTENKSQCWGGKVPYGTKF